MYLGGRGSGKTRAGAEWVRYSVLFGGRRRVCLLGPTLHDAREVMLNGPSGLLSLGDPETSRPVYHASRRCLEWPNGAIGMLYSAEEPERLRGPQFDCAWCDELAAWSNDEAVWDILQLGLRLGHQPQIVATTTPKPNPLIRRLVNGEAALTRAKTSDNAMFLAPQFLDHVYRAYGMTSLGRQELNGELLEDHEGAFWTRSTLDRYRVSNPPSRYDDIVVAVDPPTTSHDHSDACGIVAAARLDEPGLAPRAFVLADWSERRLSPMGWAEKAVMLYRKVGASRIVAEANQGGEMVKTMLQMAGCDVPIDLVHATIGKKGRAVPVAALYEQGTVSHVGCFPELEDEMCRFGLAGNNGSPDRVDALVWGINSLMLSPSSQPRMRFL